MTWNIVIFFSLPWNKAHKESLLSKLTSLEIDLLWTINMWGFCFCVCPTFFFKFLIRFPSLDYLRLFGLSHTGMCIIQLAFWTMQITFLPTRLELEKIYSNNCMYIYICVYEVYPHCIAISNVYTRIYITNTYSLIFLVAFFFLWVRESLVSLADTWAERKYLHFIVENCLLPP